MSRLKRDLASPEFDIDAFCKRLSDSIEPKSYREFGRLTGVSDTAIKKYVYGEAVPTLDRIYAMADAAEVSRIWLAFGVGPKSSHQVAEPVVPYLVDQDVVWIDSFDVFASAGNGAHNEWDHLEARAPFAKDWLRAHDLDGKKLAALKVHGDSMHPTLEHGDTVLVELLPEDAAEQLTDGVYVLRLNGSLLVKRLQSDLMGGLYIKSDNPAYDKIHLTQQTKPDDIRIIARWTEKKI